LKPNATIVRSKNGEVHPPIQSGGLHRYAQTGVLQKLSGWGGWIIKGGRGVKKFYLLGGSSWIAPVIMGGGRGGTRVKEETRSKAFATTRTRSFLAGLLTGGSRGGYLVAGRGGGVLALITWDCSTEKQISKLEGLVLLGAHSKHKGSQKKGSMSYSRNFAFTDGQKGDRIGSLVEGSHQEGNRRREATGCRREGRLENV